MALSCFPKNSYKIGENKVHKLKFVQKAQWSCYNFDQIFWPIHKDQGHASRALYYVACRDIARINAGV